jgi:hypothetical protein
VRWSGGKCAVGGGWGGGGTLHTGGRCEAIVLFLFLAVSFILLCEVSFNLHQ